MWKIINSKRKNVSVHDTSKGSISVQNFHLYFTSIASDIVKNLPSPKLDPVVSLCVNNYDILCHNYFIFKEVSVGFVHGVIASLKTSRARDIFGLNVEVLKSIKDIIASPLTKLINACIREAVFPDCLKKAVVVPLLKKDDPQDINNYRPISLLPVFSKVLEKVLAIQLGSYFEDNNIFSAHQFGFRKGRSPVDALLSLTDKVCNAFDSKETLLVEYLDLSKAFDCMCHTTLIRKLYAYNLHPLSCRLLTSFLSSRMQRVSFEGKQSEDIPIKLGIPQGSILGPLLFIIFTNDFASHLKEGGTILYADDTTLTSSGKCLQKAAESAETSRLIASDWFNSNNLVINKKKCVNMHFTLKLMDTANLDSSTSPTFEHSVNFLGLTFDSKLRWDLHGDCVNKKINKNIYLLRNLASNVSQVTLKACYFGIIHNILNYGLLIWGHSSSRHRLFAAQRRAIRILANLHYRADCRAAFKELGILTFPCMFILQCCLYVKSNISRFHTHASIHPYSTRRRHNLNQEYVRLDKTATGHRYYASKFFNALPTVMRNLNIHVFKDTLKRLLIKNAFYSYEEYLSFKFN